MIVVSFASYARRVDECAFRCACTLLDQDMPADKVILWVPNGTELPKSLTRLSGLEVRKAPYDYGSFNKLYWTLKEHPNDVIVTADDDTYYPRWWLKKLVETHQQVPNTVVSHQGTWDETKDYMAEGCGGILYPPQCFYQDVLRQDVFLKLCPKADDYWWWAQAILNGTRHHRVPEGMHDVIPYQISKDEKCGGTSLWEYNHKQGGNELAYKNLCNYYPQLPSMVQKHEYSHP